MNFCQCSSSFGSQTLHSKALTGFLIFLSLLHYTYVNPNGYQIQSNNQMGLIRKCILTSEKTKHLRSWTKQKKHVNPSGSAVFCTSENDPIFEVINLISLSPIRIWSSCFPILSGFGQFQSLLTIIPLSITILFISSMIVQETKASLLIRESLLYSELFRYFRRPVESTSKSRYSCPQAPLCPMQQRAKKSFSAFIFQYLINKNTIIIMFNRLTALQSFSFSFKAKKVQSAHRRLKYYSRFPDTFRLKTRIRAPDLTDPQLTFPIHIPIRYRHEFHLKKQIFVDDSSKIHWNRLQPNQILLAFEKCQYLEFRELVEGLKYLSEVKGQEQHNWNEHEWVKKALDKVRDNFGRLKKLESMNFYFLMKKLNYTDEIFWQKLYSKIEQNLYELHTQHFQYLFNTYYNRLEEVFSTEARGKFLKLMEGRIRQFSPNSIIFTFENFLNEKKLDTYWLENVFVSIFKEERNQFTPEHVGKIFRSMLILGHQENDRLYASLYKRISTLQFKNKKEIDELVQVLEEVKEIFISHRVEPSLEHLKEVAAQLQEEKTEKMKTMEQMVKEDLRYFLNKRKLKQQNSVN